MFLKCPYYAFSNITSHACVMLLYVNINVLQSCEADSAR